MLKLQAAILAIFACLLMGYTHSKSCTKCTSKPGECPNCKGSGCNTCSTWDGFGGYWVGRQNQNPGRCQG
jgi:hypothetical protein